MLHKNPLLFRLMTAFLVMGVLLSACATPTTEAPKPTEAPKATAAPAATAAPTAAPTAIPLTRGKGGTLKILYWQAPTILNRHLAVGTKDADSSRLVLEPLAAFGPDAKPVAVLAAEVPTLDNGGVSKDLMTITWKLKQGVKWSDGSDFSADDVVFTYDYASSPNPSYYVAFVASGGAIIQKKQFADWVGAKAKDAPGNLKPIGTGPYKIREFKPGDVVVYDMNENYRDPTKPFFKEVQFKGGGDATTAARAVFQTGDFDYAWNLQIEAAVLAQLITTGGKGEHVAVPSNSIERIMVNFANPDPALGDKRSEPDQKHPFLSDLKVRQAFAMAVDRKTIAEQLYGPQGKATCNYIVGAADVTSTNTDKMDVCTYNIDKANALLEEAGWKKGADGIRAKGNVKMSVVFQTSVNAARQKQQEIVKAGWEKIGVKVELKAIPATVYFDSSAAQPDNINHFYADFQMYANSVAPPERTPDLELWTTPFIAQKANQWRLTNLNRYSNPEFDKLFDQYLKEIDPVKRAALVIKLNDFLIADVALIPLVARAGPNSGRAKDLKGVLPNAWDSEMWNIADWSK
ncbi:MAG: peptide ABC transporter substrate-binding protein [Chloroflexi bacterium]|nr:peptide ABC transporter substrate-binding protein [Chloroflexota bacterium]